MIKTPIECIYDPDAIMEAVEREPFNKVWVFRDSSGDLDSIVGWLESVERIKGGVLASWTPLSEFGTLFEAEGIFLSPWGSQGQGKINLIGLVVHWRKS